MTDSAAILGLQKDFFEMMIIEKNMSTHLQKLNPVSLECIFNVYSEINKTGEKVDTVSIRKLGTKYSVVVRLINDESKRVYHCAITNFKGISEEIRSEVEEFFDKLKAA